MRRKPIIQTPYQQLSGTIHLEDYLSLPEAATALDLDPQILRNYISRKMIHARKIYSLTLIAKKEVERFKNERESRA